MARYIDADKLLEELNEELMYESTMFSKEQEEYLQKGIRIAIGDVKRFPAADVAPKSEVAREIFEEIFKTMTSIYSRVQRDCFGRHGYDPHTIMLVGKVEGIKYVGDEIAKFKKKYTGDSDES